MSVPTVQQFALACLRDLGITSLNPNNANETNVIRPLDLDAVAIAITQAFQEAGQDGAAEAMIQPGSAYIHNPTAITADVTLGSTTVANFTTFASWMVGCTVRFGSDTQDNEVLSATLLARPFTGVTASGATATVYNDCLTLDATVEKIVGPITLQDNRQVFEVTNRQDFIFRGRFPVNESYGGRPIPVYTYDASFLPFWALGPKQDDYYPAVYYLDTYLDQVNSVLYKRIRLSPMPNKAQSIGWTNKMTPIRVTRADIVSGLTTIVCTGASSDTNANQSYAYICDINGYRAFAGVTRPAYVIFYHPALSSYILAATASVGATPAAYWLCDLGSYPLGNFTATGTATGNITAVTTDTGAGAADPGTKIAMPNGWVESILLPIARKHVSALPNFKNTDILPQLTASAVAAKARLEKTAIAPARARTGYI